MATKQATRTPTWIWPTFGVLLLAAWVSGAAFAFLRLLQVLPDGMTVTTVGLLSWQFVIVLVAVPVLALVMIGGLKMLSYAVTIRELLKELPQQVQTFDALSEVAGKSGEQIERAKAAMTEAAGTFDQAMSQLADFESRLAHVQSSSTPPSASQSPQKDRVDELNRHLERAKEIFDTAARELEEKNGVRVERVRGWILDSSVAELRDAGAITPMEAAYIGLALEVDRKTRRSGRANLDIADLAALNAIEQNDRKKSKR